MKPTSILIEGKPNRERFTVVIDGKSIPLTLKSFKYLAILAMRRFTTETGWVHVSEFDAGGYQGRYMYRLKQEVHAVIPGLEFIENNKLGYYRLAFDGKVQWCAEGMKALPDYECRLFFEKVERKRAERAVN